MKEFTFIPRILIIDDLFGRLQQDNRNRERASLCGLYLIEDVTDDEEGKGSSQRIKKPVAQAVFYRGQTPLCSNVGDIVENDIDGTLKFIAAGWNKPPYWSLILLDLCFYTGRVTEKSNSKCSGMPEGHPDDDDPKKYFGLRILSAIKENFPNLPVVILSSNPEEQVSLDYSRQGALGFIPRAGKDGPDLLEEHIYRNGLIPDESGQIIGHSKALMFALREIRRSTGQGGSRNTLFRGETGTGKSLFARYASRQRSKEKHNLPFFEVNCPQMTQELFASELFGHKKGAFTGASDEKQGIIEKANGGDVFLDEIGELPPGVQAGILKVIEERVFTRVGETKPRSVDVRFLSATNSSLIGFREDLLIRLTEGGTINLPPLRERTADIPLLAEKFVRDAEKGSTNARERKIEPESIAKLMAYKWPGNVRELRNCIYKAVQEYSTLPYLVPEHINLPGGYFGSIVKEETVSAELTATDTIKDGFVEFALPKMLREHHKKVAEYILNALEYCKDWRNKKPKYPETWHAISGEDVKSSSTCQRNIGNYIFQLHDEDIVQFMQKSTVFGKAVVQCGEKIQSAKKRLSNIEKLSSAVIRKKL